MPQALLTSSSTRTISDRKLSDIAKHLVLPSGIKTTGYPAVAAQCRAMGVEHDDWQQALGKAMLAKRANGKYASGIGGILISICRQVGKTFTVGTIVFALCVIFPGIKVLWTAHHSATSDETFDALAALARRKLIAPYIRQVRGGNGKQRISFKNGSRIMFGAREHGFGRGIPGVAIVVFDESQILASKALNDMVPAANTVKNPLVIFMGTPPDPTDNSGFFKARRRKALAIEERRTAGEVVESNMFYLEVGANDGDDLTDPDVRRRANPSYPVRTSDDAIDRLCELLGDEGSIAREAFGIWDEDDATGRAISAPRWEKLFVAEKPADGTQALGVAFSLDGMRLSLAGAIAPPMTDGVQSRAHAELIDAYEGSMETGLNSLADWMASRWREYAGFVLSGRAGATVLAELLRKRKVPERRVIVANTPQYLQSCAGYLDEIRAGTVTHLRAEGQVALDEAVKVTDRRARSRVDGAWSWWSADGSYVHLEAVSLALYGARTLKAPRRPDPTKPKGAIL